MSEALELIHQYCPPQGLVLDMFAGTMKIGMAALRLNRRSLNIERDRDCFELARCRLKQFYLYMKESGLLVTTSGT